MEFKIFVNQSQINEIYFILSLALFEKRLFNSREMTELKYTKGYGESK
jgi:hypothetical protein